MEQAKRTIVYTHGAGRFGNQLMVLGHLIGLVAEYPEFKLVDYSFWPWSELCRGTEDNPRCEFPGSGPSRGFLGSAERAIRKLAPKRRQVAANRILGQVAHRLLPWRSVNYLNRPGEICLSAPEVLSELRQRPVTFLAGWRLREWTLFEKHQTIIRAFVKPASRFQAIADAFMRDVRSRHKFVVGVLIRQDDYRYWANGDFYFPSEHYRQFLAQLRARFGTQAAIIIATDEKQPAGIFDDLGVIWCTGEKAGPGHYLESFLELSMCDVVVSVPSTFSAWSAFFGEKPILPISTADDNLERIELLQRHLFDARLHPAFKRSIQ